MAQEPAAAPLMTPVQIAHQTNIDRIIRRDKCTFLSRIRLLPPPRENMIWKGDYSVPSDPTDDVHEVARISDFFTNDAKLQIAGSGLTCPAYGPQGKYTNVIVNLDANGVYTFAAPWMEILYRCELKETGVLSMWGFYENGTPKFIFRHDGYAGVGEELPPLTDMAPEPEENDQINNQEHGQDGGGSCCNVA